jgi:hypothetical protein
MVDVFSVFFESLYDTQRTQYSDGGWASASCERVPDFTAGEVEVQLKRMAKRKACDQAGIVAEMLQLGGASYTRSWLAYLLIFWIPKNGRQNTGRKPA